MLYRIDNLLFFSSIITNIVSLFLCTKLRVLKCASHSAHRHSYTPNYKIGDMLNCIIKYFLRVKTKNSKFFSNLHVNIVLFVCSQSPKKSLNRFEKQKRKFKEQKGAGAKQRAVEISLEGRKMSL